MILFFRTPSQSVIAAECDHTPDAADIRKLCWLFGDAAPETENNLTGYFVGPRREMITPWSTNAVEITQNMGLQGIARIWTSRSSRPIANPNPSSISKTWKRTMSRKVWPSVRRRLPT